MKKRIIMGSTKDRARARTEHWLISRNYLMCDWSGKVSFLCRSDTGTIKWCNECLKVLWSKHDGEDSTSTFSRNSSNRSDTSWT